MTKKYRILFHGLMGDEKTFKSRMIHLGVPSDVVDKLSRGAPFILKEGLTLSAARLYADAIQEAGGRVKLKEHGFFEESERINNSLHIEPLENFTMCPQCGFKQLKAENCVKCGFVFNEKKDNRKKSHEESHTD